MEIRSASKKKYQHRKIVVTLDKFNPADAMGKHRRVEVAEVIEDYIEVGEARNLKALDDVKQRLGWFNEQIGSLPGRSVTADDVEA